MTQRTIKHFSLHRTAGTELRVVADTEAGVLRLIEIEEAVVQRYAGQGLWSHQWVALFILQDLRPLLRQLRPTAHMPPGGLAALEHRPVVNIYDLADLSGCHVFVNQRAAVREGYWGDIRAMRGLLAHEHAHPLSENETVKASRDLRLDLALDVSGSRGGIRWHSDREEKVHRLLAALADELCVYAPREVFANDLVLRSGFGEALLHLNRRNATNARHSVAGRGELRQLLRQEVAEGDLSPMAAELLLLIGDLRGYLDMALEVAPFYRAGREDDAQELETILEEAVFPHLEPEVATAYTALRDEYIALRPDMTSAKLIAWEEGVLSILASAIAKKGLLLRHHLQTSGEGQG
jgi:hypothetical protein